MSANVAREKNNRSASPFSIVRWGIAGILALFSPRFTAPMGLSLSSWFEIAAPMTAIAGFGAMVLLLRKRKWRGHDLKKFVIAAGSLVAGIVLGVWYWRLLNSPR
jgi:hypothetical protein